MNVIPETVNLIKRFEGLRLKAYRDSVGVWTIGYGTTSNAGINVTVHAGMEITEEVAEAYLAETLRLFSQRIIPMFTRKPTDHEFGAMLSLAYNIGVTAFKRSTCLKRFNAGDTEGAAEALTWFNKAGGKKLRGLVRRRAAEREFMLTNDATHIETPRADPERSKAKSTTVQAVVATGVSGAGGVATILGKLDPTAQYIVLGFSGLALLGLGYILRERIRKWGEGDR